jgi:4-diphosphocytidyl-2-C-methyl-D-erythritol kinase
VVINLSKIYEKAPAKINLLLDIIRKREDGFHEVEMIMTMVDLADRL